MSDSSSVLKRSHGLSAPTPDFLWRAIRKHVLVGCLVAAGVMVAAVFHTIGAKRIYRATATLQIDPTPPRPLGNEVQNVVDMGVGSFWANREYYATQHRIIGSRAVAEQTVRSLGLQRDMRFVSNVSANAAEPRQIDTSVDLATDMLVDRVNVDPVKDSRLAVVTYEDADPDRARRILTTLIDVYLNRNVELSVNSTDAASEWLKGQVDKLRAELEKSELALHEYKKGKRLLSVSLDDQSNMLREEMQQLNQALTGVQAHKESLVARDKQLSKIDLKDPTWLPATELLNDNVLGTLRDQYIMGKTELAGLEGSGKGPNHPQVVAAAAKVETAKQALVAEIRNVQGATRSDLAGATSEAAGLASLFEQAKQRALDLNMLEIEYARLQRTKANNEKLYELVLERSKESDLTGLLRFNNIYVAEKPVVLPQPVRPQVPLNLTVGLVAGLALGLMVAIGRELLDRRLRSPEEIESELGLPFLGVLPTLDGGRSARRSRHRHRTPDASSDGEPIETIAHRAPASVVAEAARSIRTNIVFASPDNPFRKLLITSASPRDGKTMVASTIAIAMAQAGQRVVLLDADLRRARMHRIFRMSNGFGVSSAVMDPAALDSAALSTGIPNLDVLPCGPRVPNPAEVLQSESFNRLLDVLAAKYDRVVIDSPPVAAVTDAAILSTRVDGTVFVMRSFGTSRDLASRAIRAIQDVGGRIVGAVLNGVDVNRRGYGYYTYYYYRPNDYVVEGQA